MRPTLGRERERENRGTNGLLAWCITTNTEESTKRIALMSTWFRCNKRTNRCPSRVGVFCWLIAGFHFVYLQEKRGREDSRRKNQLGDAWWCWIGRCGCEEARCLWSSMMSPLTHSNVRNASHRENSRPSRHRFSIELVYFPLVVQLFASSVLRWSIAASDTWCHLLISPSFRLILSRLIHGDGSVWWGRGESFQI